MAITDNLIAYWRLEEASGQRNDSHGSLHLTDTNTVSSASGKVGTCASFAQVNSEALVRPGDDAELSLSADQAFTIQAWVSLASLATMVVLSKDEESEPNSEYQLQYDDSVNRFVFFVWDASAALNIVQSFGQATSVDTWYHVICGHDPANDVLFLSVNNVSLHTDPHTGGTRDTGATFRLGATQAAGFRWNGLMDEVAFWKRVLTTDEITWLYNAGNGRSYADLAPSASPMWERVSLDY